MRQCGLWSFLDPSPPMLENLSNSFILTFVWSYKISLFFCKSLCLKVVPFGGMQFQFSFICPIQQALFALFPPGFFCCCINLLHGQAIWSWYDFRRSWVVYCTLLSERRWRNWICPAQSPGCSLFKLDIFQDFMYIQTRGNAWHRCIHRFS